MRDRLRVAIFDGTYPPGAKLVQTEIAGRLGTSVTPVREAMRDLIAEGLISFDPHRAATVRALDVDEAIEIHELRLALEPIAARRAAERVTADDLDGLRALEQDMERAGDHQAWLEANRAFHLAVIDAARSPQLAAILENLRQISAFYLAALVRSSGGDRARSARDHRDLVEALAAHDGDRAAAIMTAHISDPTTLRDRLSAGPGTAGPGTAGPETAGPGTRRAVS
ncbi:GntR family transcriptional regulator [uncultured Cellulomonas sp.]|uniref:GntR family transcriptional regulator n=1 Tax=uncultured Cellulomonas sp. TaxID=189682 RepID=UPI00261A696F|nr:GntR family transcriptional regulator [uncultured Cellulomonas sp.]